MDRFDRECLSFGRGARITGPLCDRDGVPTSGHGDRNAVFHVYTWPQRDTRTDHNPIANAPPALDENTVPNFDAIPNSLANPNAAHVGRP